MGLFIKDAYLNVSQQTNTLVKKKTTDSNTKKTKEKSADERAQPLVRWKEDEVITGLKRKEEAYRPSQAKY